MSNKAKDIAAKDTEVFLLLIHALGQSEYFLPLHPPLSLPSYMKIDIDSNQFTNIKISDVVPEIHAITICDTTSYKFHVEKFHVQEEVRKDPYNFTLIKIIGLNINLTEKLFVQTIIYIES